MLSGFFEKMVKSAASDFMVPEEPALPDVGMTREAA
jgi:hypothetical protein